MPPDERPAPPGPRLLVVRRAVTVTPGLRRITLGGPALAGFPPGCDGAHLKLLLPRPGQLRPELPRPGPDGLVWPSAARKPVVRTYTVARHDPVPGELDIDFVLHAAPGPAADWAARARPGDEVGIAGPGGPPRFAADAGFHLLFGDLSAAALIAAVLRQLPAGARGHAVIAVDDPADCRVLPQRGALDLRWIVRGRPGADGFAGLLDAWDGLPRPPGATLSATLAGEHAEVVALRRRALAAGVARERLYAVPYWKSDADEEGYHAERHRVMDELDATPLA
ncbi:siderophore-interacting protein [Derxia gummosa]|uniref:Siderophore-interacting protein n=1 Tax=Derxia gummosa DSM 723 TaxID=1121388 RepID=A0A8B6X474_9BURK|nr:siderophore-interacting protein [Derxia gummosa]